MFITFISKCIINEMIYQYLFTFSVSCLLFVFESARQCEAILCAGYGESVECTWSDYHLPRSMLPSQYDLELQVQLEEPFTVTGAVEIHLNVTKPSRCVVLHAVGMNITHMNRLDPHTHGAGGLTTHTRCR